MRQLRKALLQSMVDSREEVPRTSENIQQASNTSTRAPVPGKTASNTEIKYFS